MFKQRIYPIFLTIKNRLKILSVMKKDKKIESRIFKKTIEILTKYNIPFWLESGTLLGIIND